ncbi:hypothetical protein SDC9_206274 [bioreactor metagenome]|uniref:Uncharacterized protein n=1 Tax=bioreactor metagenome TaxID=1076179 RepID=A0A645J5A1_9ZZZZ
MEPQAKAQIRHLFGTGVICCDDHPFNPAVSEAARYDDPRAVGKHFFHGGGVDLLGVHPFNIYVHAVFIARVLQGFRHGKVRVVKLHIFPDQADPHRSGEVLNPVQHVPPFLPVELLRFYPQTVADDFGHVLLLKHSGDAV